ncbi:MAG TPA: pantetheine-phosphate adenylyltransferase [Candidatus Saccharicenans sp.]|jgi:pantetheine-phosphate adenylyltransferase|nr:pantetheine-phosphate adenylyltransferase [Candidatus Saccharicenans sp.]HOL45089.1 pantetheine-phosphate adenylyltransferase [Candidatus Saccharicenans sp.]HOT68124.1 pantetheine-phosphate adenylyltransferase [Candidatus Saccharicenans sp.]HPC87858.1 pantetheine-phosphate adenylyltransferase [Candidatus Saccharicenans sp.]HPP23353.1 pantetheine-phosphate adenylyltransferase [Candidatus Saccharicenans sp.]
MERKAIYPGSFDPITNGHVDIIQRGKKIFDSIIVGVLDNPKKTPFFSTEERVELIEQVFANDRAVEVKSFSGLLVDFAHQNKVNIVIRGLRAISDFEYEFQMALMNRKLAGDIETLFMMPSLKYSFLSSNLVREAFQLGGCVKGLVPPLVEEALKNKLSNSKRKRR